VYGRGVPLRAPWSLFLFPYICFVSHQGLADVYIIWYPRRTKEKCSEGYRERHPLGDCISIINDDDLLHLITTEDRQARQPHDVAHRLPFCCLLMQIANDAGASSFA